MINYKWYNKNNDNVMNLCSMVKFIQNMFVIVLLISLAELSRADDYVINDKPFPSDFHFGAANAAPQIEGAWNIDGRSPSIWDDFAHQYPEKIADRSTPDIAADSYTKFKEDVALVKAMGLKFYRFSISWSRILPTGYSDYINYAGVEYYKKLIIELRRQGLEPMVTMYHWDMPQVLQETMGGWSNFTIVPIFSEYARMLYSFFGDDVKWWNTINEPKQICYDGYGRGVVPPLVNRSGIGEYICAFNILMSHAKAYRLYMDKFHELQKGKITMVIDTPWMEPASDDPADIEAAERALQFQFGWFANPIFNGDWPEVMKERIANRSYYEGFNESRLPKLNSEQIADIKNTYDYIAVNHYTTFMVNDAEAGIGEPSYMSDMGVKLWQKPEWPVYHRKYSVVPWGLRKLLVWVKKTYGDLQIIITENGLSDTNATLEDDQRINYYQGYLSNCLDAIYEDGVKLTTYITRSIIDNWEWTSGYLVHLGMHHVNFTDPQRTRTQRKSAYNFTNIVKTRCLLEDGCTGPKLSV